MRAISFGPDLMNRAVSLLVSVSEARPTGRATLVPLPMSKTDYIDFQDRSEALGFPITFRTYGTWLHGELNSFKSYATRKLREARLLDEAIRPWARHGSTPYLWTEDDVQAAIDYVINGQGDEPFR